MSSTNGVPIAGNVNDPLNNSTRGAHREALLATACDIFQQQQRQQISTATALVDGAMQLHIEPPQIPLTEPLWTPPPFQGVSRHLGTRATAATAAHYPATTTAIVPAVPAPLEMNPHPARIKCVVPVGFFRDPLGNKWAASLMPPVSTRTHDSTNPLSLRLPPQAQRQPILPLPPTPEKVSYKKQRAKKELRGEVIDLQSDDEASDNDGKDVTKPNAPEATADLEGRTIEDSARLKGERQEQSMASPSITAAKGNGELDKLKLDSKTTNTTTTGIDTLVSTAPTHAEADGQSTNNLKLPPRESVPTVLAQMSEIAGQDVQPEEPEEQPPVKRSKVDSSLAQPPPALATLPSQEEMRERHERARQYVNNSKSDKKKGGLIPSVSHRTPKQGSSRNFVSRWLREGPNEAEKEHDVQNCIDTFLTAAMGYSSSAVPANVCFPPPEITLDLHQVEELAQTLVHQKIQSIRGAVRCAFMEMKPDHDEVMMNYKRALSEFKKAHRENVALENKHKLRMSDLKQEHEQINNTMQKQVDMLKEELSQLIEEQTYVQKKRSNMLDAMITASVCSLRLMTDLDPSTEEE